MKIFLIGAVQFSAAALQELISMNAQIVGICTVNEAIYNSDHCDLTAIAQKHSIPVAQQRDLEHPETLHWIRMLSPDVIFCLGWSRLLRSELLNLAPKGVVGYHPAALPKNRGRHPIIWALALGLSTTASTFFLMDEGIDSGDILSQIEVPIYPEDDAAELYKRITKTAVGQLRELVPKLTKGTYCRKPQEQRGANVWRKRRVEDGIIDWRMAAQSIHNLVRGLSYPYVGASFYHFGEPIKVWKTEVIPYGPENIEPGKVLTVDNRGPVVKTGIGSIRLLEFSPAIALQSGDYL
jgi:methionyl-tRNA formyltransferase